MKWDQYWVGPWTFFTSVLYITSYTSLMNKRVGFGLTDIFITSKRGYTYCYFQHEERKAFAEFVICAIIETGKLPQHISLIKSSGDALCELIADLQKKEVSPDEFRTFMELFKEYNGPHITMRNTSDFLDTQKYSEATAELREARVYTEKVYKATEDFIHYYGKQL